MIQYKYFLLLLIIFPILSYSQEDKIDEKTKQREERQKEAEAKRDSLRAAERAGQQRPRTTDEETRTEADTSEAIQVLSNLFWYNSENRLLKKSERSRHQLFTLADEKLIIFRDVSDIFRRQPLWFDFDLIENGRPAYVSMINTLPHQTPVFFGGMLMNDQLQGAFNTQFIPLNYIQTAEADFSSGGLQNHGLWAASRIHLTPNSKHTEKPWTRIFYKQGAFGYADTDVYFELPFDGRFAVQLGGMRKLSTGSFPDSDYDGANYRAEITWQYSPAIYLRSQLFLNRNGNGLFSFDETQKVQFPQNTEARNDYMLDLTWLINDSTGQRLHLLMYHSNYQRKFTNRYSNYTFETKSFRYGLDANYNIFIGKSELLLGIGAILPQFYSDPFKEKPYIPSQNAYASYRLPVDSLFQLRAAAQVVHVKDFSMQLIPSLALDLFISENQSASVNFTTGKRLPTAVERFFDFDTLNGNRDLSAESYFTLYSQYSYENSGYWSVKLHGGYHRIDQEILWQDPLFINGDSRDFTFFGMETTVNWWKLSASVNGQYTMADINLTPRSSIWGQIRFHDVFLNGALVLDAIGTAIFNDRHEQIRYHPRLDRFYTGSGQTEGYMTLNWKIVATITNAHLFIEMENALSEDYEVVYGYFEFYRRLRFGVNWILWD